MSSDKPRKRTSRDKEKEGKGAGGGAKAPDNSDAVRALDAGAQTDLLAQALLREYMHRKGYKETLAAFDVENPRTAQTIASRALMNELLVLQIAQARNGERPAGPLGTIMEVLCSYRLRKRGLRADRAQRGGGAAYEICGPHDAVFDSSDEEEALAMAAERRQAAVDERRAEIARLELVFAEESKSRAEAKAAAKKDKKEKKEKKEKKDKKKSVTIDDGALQRKGSDTRSRSVLDAAMTSLSHFPMGGSAGSGAACGRNWAPGGAVPTVGLSAAEAMAQSGAARPADSDEEYRAPNFMAGTGFNLSTNRVHAAVGATDLASLRHPTDNSPSGTPSRSSDREDVPSPYASLGTVRFDPGASAKSVLSRRNDHPYNNGGLTDPMGLPLSGPGSSSGGSSSGYGGGGGGVGSRRGVSFNDVSPAASPPAGEAASPPQLQKVGFGFNRDGSPGSGRKQRSQVTIITE